MSLFLITPHEMGSHIAKRVRERRLSVNLSQKTVSQQAGVSLAVLKKFEQTGKISLESLLKIALVLGSLEEFRHLFKAKPLEHFASLDELLKNNEKRQRGRQ